MTGRLARLLAGVLAICVAPGLAQAHPHVLVDAQESLVFDAHGDLTGIAGTWSFDEAFSAYAVQGYDSKGDGQPTREDLQPLAQTNVESLDRYHFFTRVLVDGMQVQIGNPTNAWDEFAEERLVLHFTLPLRRPLRISGHTLSVEVFDPDYFAAVTFPELQATSFASEPKDCQGMIRRPAPLDATAAGRLAQVPVTQRDLPPDLRAITDRLINAIVLRCH